jgi:hypothetical protein
MYWLVHDFRDQNQIFGFISDSYGNLECSKILIHYSYKILQQFY